MPSFSSDRVSRGLKTLAAKRGVVRDRFYAWWWWRSGNRPHVVDDTYIRLLNQVSREARGLDLGSRSRIRKDAVTLDVVRASGVDVVGDAHQLPFREGTFDYVWCNAVLEHVPYPMRVAAEIRRVLKPGGLVFVQVPFLEYVHGWPDDYYRFTLQGLRVVFRDMTEVASGVSAGPGQVLPDLVQYYCTLFADVQARGLLANLSCLLPGLVLMPLRVLDRVLRHRPSYWMWARGYYWVGSKDASGSSAGCPAAATRVAAGASCEPGSGEDSRRIPGDAVLG